MPRIFKLLIFVTVPPTLHSSLDLYEEKWKKIEDLGRYLVFRELGKFAMKLRKIGNNNRVSKYSSMCDMNSYINYFSIGDEQEIKELPYFASLNDPGA